MSLQECYDFAIIGCGMAGASLAYELSEQGASVVVLEAESQAAFHTTGRSAAFYMEAYGNDCVRKITQASRAFYDHPPEDFCDNPLLLPCGALYLGTEAQEQNINRTYQTLRERIKGCQRVDHSFIKRKLPRIRDCIQHGFWEPNSMEIDVNELLSGYLKLARRNKVDFVFNAPLAQAAKKHQGWLLNNKYKAQVLVNAAGAWADQVAELAGAQKLGLEPKQRNICIAEVDKSYGSVRDWPLSLDIDERFYFKPYGEHLLITPADEISARAHDAQADDYQVALGVDRVQAILDMSFTHLKKKWAGLRTFSTDKSPITGFDPECRHFFWLAGQGGYGIQMAPALAKLAASLATGNHTVDIEGLDLEDVSPKRFY